MPASAVYCVPAAGAVSRVGWIVDEDPLEVVTGVEIVFDATSRLPISHSGILRRNLVDGENDSRMLEMVKVSSE